MRDASHVPVPPCRAALMAAALLLACCARQEARPVEIRVHAPAPEEMMSRWLGH